VVSRLLLEFWRAFFRLARLAKLAIVEAIACFAQHSQSEKEPLKAKIEF
jgi:hypothetical protein